MEFYESLIGELIDKGCRDFMDWFNKSNDG